MTSIRCRLTLGLLAACSLLFAASGAVVWLSVRSALLRQFDASLRARAAFIQANVEEDDGKLELELRLEPLSPVGDGAAPVFYQVWSADGIPCLKSDSLGSLELPLLPVTQGPLPPPVSRHVLEDGTPVRAVSARFDARDDKYGQFRNVTMVTARTTLGIDSTLRLLLWILIGAGLAAALLMAPLIHCILARGLQPLCLLARRTAAIDVRALDTRLPEDESPDELRPVVNRLNELLGRLEASFERERRFSSDAAHELRTPVAELQALSELVGKWPEQATPSRFAQVHSIAQEMEDVISRLTFLSRAEAGKQPVVSHEVALDAVVADTLSRQAGAASRRAMIFEARLQPVTRQTDGALFRMVVSNLLDNAVHHAPAGAVVEVNLDSLCFSVRNPAPGLSAADLPHLADRFWRKDAARAGYGHSGLGLSLVQSLTGLLGFALTPTLYPNGALEMKVAFAAAPKSAG